MKPPRYTFAPPYVEPEPESVITPWKFAVGLICFFVIPFLYGFFS